MTAPSFAPFGVAVGHATDEEGGTGLTVLRGVSGPLAAGVCVLGRATGSRELPAAMPGHLVDRVDAVLLSGGSAYGLDAAAGVMRWMEERGRGFPVGAGVVPIVPAAVVFDLAPIGRFDARPTAAMAYAACDAAAVAPIAEGSVGAGTGCTVGKALGGAHAMKGGLGGSVAEGGGAAVGALAVVNALGDVRGADGAIVAGARAPGGRFADAVARLAVGGSAGTFADVTMRNTTLAVVVTSARLGRAQLAQLAAAASAALHRRITPAGTSYDGDVVFALGPPGGGDGGGAPPVQLEVLAVRALEAAIERAVRAARGRDGVPGLADGAPIIPSRAAPADA